MNISRKGNNTSLLGEAIFRVKNIFMNPKIGIYKTAFAENCESVTPPNGASAYVNLSSQLPILVKSDSTAKPSKSNSTGDDKGDEYKSSLESGLIYEREFVISSYLYSLNPADRLEKVYSLITPIHPGVEFMRYLTGEDKKPISYGIEDTILKLETQPGGIPLFSRRQQIVSARGLVQRTLNRKISREFVTQNVEIFPLRNILFISQDGGPAGADISGNAKVRVVV